MKAHLILLAGGRGSRFGSPLPKQFLSLDGAPLFHKGLGTHRQVSAIEQTVIVIDPEFHSYLPDGTFLLATPGATRTDSVRSGFQQLSAFPGDLILIHDGARPYVCLEDVEALLRATKRLGAAALGSPMVHTLKKVIDGKIEATLPRDNLWEVYTPQCIEYSLLKEGLSLDIPCTDDVSLIEALGKPVAMVKSTKPIQKVTYKEDYAALNV